MRNPIRLKNLQPRYLPLYGVLVAVLLLCQPSRAGLLVGGALVLAGASLRSWSAGHLVKTRELTITGPYARMRHPLYTGTLVIAVGFALIVGGWLSLGLLAVFLPWFFFDYFPRKEASEAARLVERYGAAYEDYRRRVPALLPGRAAYRMSAGRVAPVGGERNRWSPARYADNNELGTLLGLALLLVGFWLRALPSV